MDLLDDPAEIVCFDLGIEPQDHPIAPETRGLAATESKGRTTSRPKRPDPSVPEIANQFHLVRRRGRGVSPAKRRMGVEGRWE